MQLEENENLLILVTPIPLSIQLCFITTPLFGFHCYESDYESYSDSLASENQP